MIKNTFIKVVSIIIFAAISLTGQSGSPNVPFLANFNDYFSTGYNDCWGYTAPNGREYALLGVLDGTSIIDITDTGNLVEIDFIPGNYSGWKDIKTYLFYAYVVNETGGGLQIIDLSNLPASVSLANTYNGISASHNIYIDELNGILYAEGTASDPVIVISLADPVNPTQLSTLGVECHDVFSLNDVLYVSEGNTGSIGIFDMTLPGSPSLLRRHFIPSAGYVHNAWATEDGNYLMTTEETSGKTIKLWDISDLNNITLTDEILASDGLAHNTHIKKNYSYVSHYTNGLRIYDISDPYNIFEAGYYDTWPSSGGGFDGAWGAFPFFQSGKILISDRTTGLYVVYFDGAADVDSLDPKNATNLSAYSDYTTPTSIYLTWQDPDELVNGNQLNSSDFNIEIYRDDTLLVATVPGGNENFTDSGLLDGNKYSYKLITKIILNDSSSLAVQASWMAGGSPISSAPGSVYILDNQSPYTIKWTNPKKNIDGTPLDDFAGVKLYENDILISTFSRTASDSGKSDSASFTASGYNDYYLVAFDNENPSNDSEPSNSAYKPLSLPLFDSFPTNAVINPAHWINTNAEVNNVGVNPPSSPYVLSLDAHPTGGDKVESLPFYLEGLSGSQVLLSYWYQPQGSGNAPELGDELYLDFLNSHGQWINIRTYPGSSVTNFVNETIDVATQNAGTDATFLFPAFQFRFRNIGTADAISHYDFWLIDDVSLDIVPNGIDNDPSLPVKYSISPNFPNPFNPTTTINFELPKAGDVSLVIYNVLGQEVKTLIKNNIQAGKYSATWNGKGNNGSLVASGVYVYEFRADNYVKTQKMVLMK
jgi:choice-of-anchor B domain-containing protein